MSHVRVSAWCVTSGIKLSRIILLVHCDHTLQHVSNFRINTLCPSQFRRVQTWAQNELFRSPHFARKQPGGAQCDQCYFTTALVASETCAFARWLMDQVEHSDVSACAFFWADADAVLTSALRLALRLALAIAAQGWLAACWSSTTSIQHDAAVGVQSQGCQVIHRLLTGRITTQQ